MANGETEDTAVRYERRDIRFGCLLAFMLVVLCIMASLGYGVWRFFWWQNSARQEAGRSPYPLAPAASKQLPPEPRLEQIDRLAGVENSDVAKRLAGQEKVLNSYGPTEEKGFVHIPIQQAIKATAGTLPVRKPSAEATAKDKGLVDSGESNSGRMFRGEP